ncbi:DUF2946 family protein [Paraburkholderia solisilvae]|uniref:DUF2946 domain-containing protein n=1 Tax=Paraburkholderia solisilvae TaxID=624376 RepID=A0A6J5DPD6_9BURK|nr:DUF2946 family protein [Paraburkholderia solisilvae]CAB3755803.1 hypothetical protein LMG29739_02306 [Paraburkholderia solisilvae]
MDEIVRQALAKWPNVPHCTGWLLLDRRGTWRMRDDAAQARGALGEPIRHAALIGFINRNYECDDDGQWFFQNGPQRVYVELVYTPWIVRLSADESSGGALTLTDHTGQPFTPAAVFVDDEGGVLFADDASPARVAALHDHDLDLFSGHAELVDDCADGASGAFNWRDGHVLPLQPIERAKVAARFEFVASPAARAAAAVVATDGTGDRRDA